MLGTEKLEFSFIKLVVILFSPVREGSEIGHRIARKSSGDWKNPQDPCLSAASVYQACPQLQGQKILSFFLSS